MLKKRLEEVVEDEGGDEFAALLYQCRLLDVPEFVVGRERTF